MIRASSAVNLQAASRNRVARFPFHVPPWSLPGVMAAKPAERFRLALLSVILARRWGRGVKGGAAR